MTSSRTETSTVLGLGGRTVYASGLVAAIGVVFLIAMFASFAVGATTAGQVFGWINDVSVMVSYLLAAPSAIAIGALLRPQAPILSGLATVIGIGAIAAIVVLQALLVVGAMTFEAQIGPASIAFLVLVVWFVMTGYLGSSSGALPHGVRMGLIAATYVGYPFWAFWLGRNLLQPVKEPVSGPGGDAERYLPAREG